VLGGALSTRPASTLPRVLRHRRPQKAVVTVAPLLRIVCHVLADGTVYRDLGGDYHDRQHRQRVTRRAVQLLQRRGWRSGVARV